MYYMPEERLNIGRRVFTQEILKEKAASEYNISITTVVNYVKEYMKANKAKRKTKEKSNNKSFIDWMFVACLNYQFFVLKRYRQILKVSFNVRKLQIKLLIY